MTSTTGDSSSKLPNNSSWQPAVDAYLKQGWRPFGIGKKYLVIKVEKGEGGEEVRTLECRKLTSRK